MRRAVESAADVVIFDLEDAVAAGHKAEARKVLATPLAPDFIILPKCASAADLLPLDAQLAVLERVNSLEVGRIRLLPLATESALSVAGLDYRSAPERLAALVFAAEDLSADLGISTARGMAIIEEQDLVYREAAVRGCPIQAPSPVTGDATRPQADWRVRMKPDPVLLFRYSAMTFNGHRIHYDLRYAGDREGYRALVVHGPLTASLLAAQLTANRMGRITRYSFRAEQPLFCGEEMALCGKETRKDIYDLWAETPHGQVAMSASACIEQNT